MTSGGNVESGPATAHSAKKHLSRMPTGEDIVAFLQRPDAYPEPTCEVQTIETHMSWVFLTDRFAYKLKKPYRRDVIDYGSPQARRRNCLREIRLNRRLAPQVYLGVMAVSCDRGGCLHIDGGEPVDWLVRMRHLPLVRTLEHRLRLSRAGREDAERIVDRLLTLYEGTPRARLSAVALRRRTLADIAESERILLDPQYDLPMQEVTRLAAALRRHVTRHGDQLTRRVRSGVLADGHGDLRPEHIYLDGTVTIIDCIEFDRNLRLRDPVDELAFLALECERLGDARWRNWLLSYYTDRCGDQVPSALVDFYQAVHALKRARLSVLHIGDPGTGPAWHWITSARDYLRLGLTKMFPGKCAPEQARGGGGVTVRRRR